MAPVLLSKEDHKELKIQTGRSEEMGDIVSYCMVVPHEFRDVKHHYPIFFRQLPDQDVFLPMAMLGLEPNENLFIADGQWQCRYIPLIMAVQPFVIGRADENSDEGRVFIDEDSPRIAKNANEGVRIFDDFGNETPFMQGIVGGLETLHQGDRAARAMSEWLQKYDLLESFALEVELKDGSRNRLLGFHTINEKKIAELEEAALKEMVEKGYMMPIHMILASLASISDLIELKNQRM